MDDVDREGADGAGAAARRKPVALADADELDAFVAEHPLALVEFYTEGCGVCASMEPVLGTVAKTSDAAVGYVNPRDDPPLVERFDVRSVPLLVVFEDGEPVRRRAEGFQGVDAVLSLIEGET